MADQEQSAAQQIAADGPKPASPQGVAGPEDSVWERIQRHKVVEWSLAYIAFGYAALHGSQMLRETFEWPLVVPRFTFFVLLLGLPFAVTLAWYHGHRAQHRVSRTEISILAALLVIAGSVLWFVSGSPHRRDAESFRTTHRISPDSAASEDTIGASNKALAVLPFADLSQGHDQDYLADGMAEEILDLLTRIPQLTVIGRTSSFQFKGKNEDLRTVGSKLGAAYIVEGSVRTAGPRVRVTAQLIDTRTGSHVWSESYDRNFRDVLVLQDEVATSLARELRLVVTPVNQRTKESVRSPEAYMLYLRGRLAFDRGDMSALRESQADFEQALALEPTLTRAAEGLLLTDLNLVYDNGVPSTTGWPLVRELAQDILRRNPTSVFAHSALAWVHAYYDYDLAGCNHELDAAVAGTVNDPVALMYSAWIAAVVRRMDLAERLIHQAVISDPLSPDAYQGLGAILRDAGDLAGAEHAFRQSISISPTFAYNHLYLAQVLYYRTQFADALVEANAEESSPARQSFLAGIQFVLGHKRESDALLAELTRNVRDGDAYWIATAYTMRGEKDQAFEWLNKAYVSRDLSLHTPNDPVFAALREDPRWGTFVNRMLNQPNATVSPTPSH